MQTAENKLAEILFKDVKVKIRKIIKYSILYVRQNYVYYTYMKPKMRSFYFMSLSFKKVEVQQIWIILQYS